MSFGKGEFGHQAEEPTSEQGGLELPLNDGPEGAADQPGANAKDNIRVDGISTADQSGVFEAREELERSFTDEKTEKPSERALVGIVEKLIEDPEALKQSIEGLIKYLASLNPELVSKTAEEIKEVSLEDLQKELQELMEEEKKIRSLLEEGAQGGRDGQVMEQQKLEDLVVKIAVLVIKIAVKVFMATLKTVAEMFGSKGKSD